jgi:hypothetical protein
MTDVREVLKLIYGKDVPKYLGDFMDYVSLLEFDEGKYDIILKFWKNSSYFLRLGLL